jgi:hypothetical protein
VIKNKNLGYYEVEVLITIAKELQTEIMFDERYANSNLYSNNDALIK